MAHRGVHDPDDVGRLSPPHLVGRCGQGPGTSGSRFDFRRIRSANAFHSLPTGEGLDRRERHVALAHSPARRIFSRIPPEVSQQFRMGEGRKTSGSRRRNAPKRWQNGLERDLPPGQASGRGNSSRCVAANTQLARNLDPWTQRLGQSQHPPKTRRVADGSRSGSRADRSRWSVLSSPRCRCGHRTPRLRSVRAVRQQRCRKPQQRGLPPTLTRPRFATPL